jgi:membrane associated rhomboid family serine protease
VLFANSEIYIYGVFPLKAKYFTLGLIGFELWRGFQANPSDNVAHFAHLGGALIGYLLVKFWSKNRDFLY